MKKETFTLLRSSLLAIAFLLTTTLFAQLPNSEFFTGAGTSEDPIQISNYADLDSLCRYFSVAGCDTIDSLFFSLEADIDASSEDSVICMQWFNNFFDGKGNTITGLKVTTSNAHDAGLNLNQIGLFGRATDSTIIKNLRLVDVSVYAGNRSGIIVGQANGYLMLDNISVSGKINTTDLTGSLIGRVNNGSTFINNCFVNTEIISRNTEQVKDVGGIVGQCHGSNPDTIAIANCVVDAKAVPANFGGENGIYDVVISTLSSDAPVAFIGTENIFYFLENCVYGETIETASTPARNSYSATSVSGTAAWGNAASFTGLDFDNVWEIVDGAPALQDLDPQGPNVSEKEMLSAKVFISNGMLMVDSPSPITNVAIYSLTGKALIQTKNTEIAVNELPRGLYIAKIYSGRRSLSTKFIK